MFLSFMITFIVQHPSMCHPIQFQIKCTKYHEFRSNDVNFYKYRNCIRAYL